MARERTSYDIAVQEKPDFDQSVLTEGGSDIQVVADDKALRELNKLGEDWDFMNEMVTIRFLPSRDPNDARMCELGVTVTGKGKDGRPIVKSFKKGFERGKPYTVPRFVAEAAAHSKFETLEQYSDPRDPYRVLQRATPAFSYPFEILRDSPRGRAYLEQRMSDPA